MVGVSVDTIDAGECCITLIIDDSGSMDALRTLIPRASSLLASNLSETESWMVCFGLSCLLNKNLKLILLPSHVKSEAPLYCCDYFGRWWRNGLCNMWVLCKCQPFFISMNKRREKFPLFMKLKAAQKKQWKVFTPFYSLNIYETVHLERHTASVSHPSKTDQILPQINQST